MAKLRKEMLDFFRIKKESDFRLVLNNYGLTYDFNKTQASINCPFHDDSSPSCKINFEKNIFNCFGCHTSGNIIDFVCYMENLNPQDGKDFRKGGILVQSMALIGKKSPPEPQKQPVRDEKHKPIPTVGVEEKEAYNGNLEVETGLINKPLSFAGLKLNQEHSFFNERSITQAEIERFGLGFCNRGIMKDRICFPIHNVENKLIGYIGRWAEKEIPEKITRYRIPKGFNKSVELYNLNRLILSKTDLKHIVIVEGFWSVIKLDSFGVAVVSVFGTNISDSQIEILKTYGVEKVTLIFDGDEAGRIGTEEAVKKLTKVFYTKAIFLEEGIKPDTMDMEEMKNFM